MERALAFRVAFVLSEGFSGFFSYPPPQNQLSSNSTRLENPADVTSPLNIVTYMWVFSREILSACASLCSGTAKRKKAQKSPKIMLVFTPLLWSAKRKRFLGVTHSCPKRFMCILVARAAMQCFLSVWELPSSECRNSPALSRFAS